MLRCSGDFKETANNKEKGGTKGAIENREYPRRSWTSSSKCEPTMCFKLKRVCFLGRKIHSLWRGGVSARTWFYAHLFNSLFNSFPSCSVGYKFIIFVFSLIYFFNVWYFFNQENIHLSHGQSMFNSSHYVWKFSLNLNVNFYFFPYWTYFHISIHVSLTRFNWIPTRYLQIS